MRDRDASYAKMLRLRRSKISVRRLYVSDSVWVPGLAGMYMRRARSLETGTDGRFTNLLLAPVPALTIAQTSVELSIFSFDRTGRSVVISLLRVVISGIVCRVVRDDSEQD